jgi:multiple sugar transport system substrate-binding protein
MAGYAGVSAEETYEPITIKFWNSWTGSDGQLLIDYVDEFNETNKWNITVDMDISSEFSDKITTAMAADAAPALILSSPSGKYDYEGKVRRLDDIWENTDLEESDFVASYLDSLSTEDGLYGIPFQVSSYLMYWNKDLFEKAGLDPETPPSTYEEWTEFAQQLTDADSHVYGSGLSYSNVGANACIMQMFGGLQVTEGEDGKWQANFAGNQGYIDFVSWFKEQFDNGSNPTESDLDTMFVSNQLGLYVTGAWLMTDLNIYGVNYGVTTLIETEAGGKQAPSNTQCFMITTSATEEEALAAERFISWWHTGNDGAAVEDTAVYNWSDQIGYPTYYIPVAESEGYQNNEIMQAITVTDPEYCMDSVSPGSFRCWGSVLTGPLLEFFNTMTFEEDTSSVLETCQEQADKIISDEYGY